MINPSQNPRIDTPATQPPPPPPEASPCTALAAVLANAPSLAEYRGAQTTRVFSTPAQELAALLTGTGVYDLGWRGFLRASGRDRVRWLNGMVTNSVKGLEENTGCYAFVLNAQGRIQGDLDLYRRAHDPEALWIRIDRSQIETISSYLRRYIIMDQVALEPQPEWTALGVAGPHASEPLTALGLPVGELAMNHLAKATWKGRAVTVLFAHSPLVPRYEIWIESRAALDLWNSVIKASAAPCGTEALEHLRILEGTPAYGVDISDRDLPQETGQVRALHFNKGCYLGQEIVERIRSRGNVHRALSGFQIEGDPIPPGTPILAEGNPAGDLTSIAQVELPGIVRQTIALGRIRREALGPETTLTADEKVVHPVSIPFNPSFNKP